MESQNFLSWDSFSEINVTERGIVLGMESLNLGNRYAFSFPQTHLALSMCPFLF